MFCLWVHRRVFKKLLRLQPPNFPESLHSPCFNKHRLEGDKWAQVFRKSKDNMTLKHYWPLYSLLSLIPISYIIVSLVFWRLHRAAFHCFTLQSSTALNAEVHGAGAVNSFHHIWSSSCSWRVALGIGGLQENSSLGPRLQGWNRTQTKSTQRMDIWQKDIGELMVVDNLYIFIHSHTVLRSSQHILAG